MTSLPVTSDEFKQALAGGLLHEASGHFAGKQVLGACCTNGSKHNG